MKKGIIPVDTPTPSSLVVSGGPVVQAWHEEECAERAGLGKKSCDVDT